MVKHQLRKRYRDPITESNEWGVIRDGQSQISSVYSLSQDTPIMTQKDARFALDGSAKTYSSWKFVFKPSNTNPPSTHAQDGQSETQAQQ